MSKKKDLSRPESKKKVTNKLTAYKPGSFKYVWYKIYHSPSAMIGLCFIVVLFILSFISPYICKYDYQAISMKLKCATPSWEHPFGCDEIGRDILSRVLYGAKYTMSIGILCTAFSCIIGCILGALAGYFGRWVDNIIMRIMDVLQAFPAILLAIVISSVLGSGYFQMVVALGISAIPGYARMMRASILNIRESEYIEAEKSMNCPTSKIILKHIIPNAMSPIIVQAAMGIASAGLAASALSFLGFGLPVTTPEWGAMLSSARDYMREYPHLAIFPGLFIMLTVVSYNLIGDTVRDALDPKLKD
ncbi:MAG: ABC transporter permease [Oscillospiraceae bacterium]|jgi:peptide/nickel transport system permease protein